MLLGVISPKISTVTVTTTVDKVAPASWSPCMIFTNIKVPIDANVIFTILLPVRMVEISLSYFSSKESAKSAFLFPFSERAFSRVLLREEKAVSVALK